MDGLFDGLTSNISSTNVERLLALANHRWAKINYNEMMALQTRRTMDEYVLCPTTDTMLQLIQNVVTV